MPAKKSSKTTQKRLVLLDAHALLHRAYHALPDFMNTAGMPTGGLYGFTSMIIRIAADWKPDYIVACYDLPQPTFRHEAYDAYKGKRAKTDDSLIVQINASRELCAKLGIPIYDKPGFEADDMLGTIVEQVTTPSPRRASALPLGKGEKPDTSDVEILIATGDMDSLQLVDGKRVRVFTQKKANETVVYDEDAVIERFGFGPELLPDYKGLRGDPSDNIIGVPGIGEKTATDLILKFGTIENIYKKLHKDREVFLKEGIRERVVNLLAEHEEGALFSKTLATIRRDAPIEFRLPEKRWCEDCVPETVEPLMREYGFKSLIARLKEAVEGATKGDRDARPDAGKIRKADRSEAIPKDLQIAMWLLNSDLTNITAADALAYARASNMDDARNVILGDIKNHHLEYVFEHIECPLIPILAGMQSYGILIDTDFLKNLSTKLHKELTAVESRIYKHAGREFNIGSPKQLGEIVFGEMMLHTSIKGFRIKKTASGTYSTREEDLMKLEGVHPIIDDIFKYRELAKLLSTYIDAIPQLADAASRIHPELVQTGAVTGRFSSQNPSIQNIPIKSDTGREIRCAFVAPEGSSIIAADYSQIELRVAAMMSGDPTFVETFRQGYDIHASVASRVFHVEQNDVTNNQRRQAKVINFGILYGMGVTALQKNLGTNRAEAQEFYDNYFRELPKLADYMDNAILLAKKNGYTTTLFGRRRNFTGLKSPLPYLRAMAERAAGNAPIQGTAADMIKLAMIRVDENLKKSNLDSKVHMIMQIHDELVFECEDSVVDRAKKIIKESMEHVLENIPFEIEHKVPIEVSVSSGKNWGETKG